MFFDVEIVYAIQQFMMATPLRVAVAVLLARWLILGFLLLLAFLFISKQAERRHAVVDGAWAVVLTLAVTAVIAYFVQRTRPYLGDANTDIILPITRLIPAPFNTSFPSGHTGTAVTLAAAIFSVHRRLGILAIIMAALVAFGRVAVGVHYPTDLLGGVLVGLSCFALVRFLHRQIRSRDILSAARHHHY